MAAWRPPPLRAPLHTVGRQSFNAKVAGSTPGEHFFFKKFFTSNTSYSFEVLTSFLTFLKFSAMFQRAKSRKVFKMIWRMICIKSIRKEKQQKSFLPTISDFLIKFPILDFEYVVHFQMIFCV